MGVHHLAFRTRDVDLLTAFYRDVVGLTEVPREGTASRWLSLGATAVLMIERAGESEPTVAPGGMDLVALGVDTAGRDAVREALAHRGVPIESETVHTTYFRDPDGRRIAVSTYPLPVGPTVPGG